MAGEIDHWCSGETIRQLFAKCNYKNYVERIVPIIGDEQREKNLAFAKLRSNWGQGAGKYLIVNVDEKWMVGMLARHAKMCDMLGLERTNLFAQHKNHIAKLMVLAITGYAFEDHFENGGVGVLLGLHRIVAAKIAQKAQNAYRRKKNGKMGFPDPGEGMNGCGERLRNGGEAWMVPAPITGSNSGTPDAPKFSLLQLLQETVFPQLVELTKPGALFHGYTVVWQWDNAGPHGESGLMDFVTPFCAEHGWNVGAAGAADADREHVRPVRVPAHVALARVPLPQARPGAGLPRRDLDEREGGVVADPVREHRGVARPRVPRDGEGHQGEGRQQLHHERHALRRPPRLRVHGRGDPPAARGKARRAGRGDVVVM